MTSALVRATGKYLMQATLHPLPIYPGVKKRTVLQWAVARLLLTAVLISNPLAIALTAQEQPEVLTVDQAVKIALALSLIHI